MRSVGINRGARTIGLALVAGLVAVEAGLANRTGAVGIPGVAIVPLGEGNRKPEETQVASALDGGETVITKLPQIEARAEQTASVSPPAAAPPAGEQKLSGLSDEPPWDRDHAKPEKPTTFTADSGGKEEVLPWDAVEPVPFDSGPASAA